MMFPEPADYFSKNGDTVAWHRFESNLTAAVSTGGTEYTKAQNQALLRESLLLFRITATILSSGKLCLIQETAALSPYSRIRPMVYSG